MSKTMNRKLVFFVTIMLFSSFFMRSCASEERKQTKFDALRPEVGIVKFCPIDKEQEARKLLVLGDSKKLKIENLLKIYDAKKISYEEKETISLRCEDSFFEAPPNSRYFQVHTGFDENRTHTRSFLIVADGTTGIVIYIKAQYAYQPPKLWSE